MSDFVDTIIFDAEGVVVDTEIIWDRAQEEFLRHRDRVYDRYKTKYLITGKSILEGTKILIHEYELRGDPEELARERKEIINKLLDSEVNYVKGFQEFFHLIKGDYKTCIASSIDYELLEIIDRHLELRKLFGNRVYIISDVNCPSKPDPCIFNYAAKKLESEQKNCVVIEDSPNGIKAAKAAGMKCIAIATTHEREKLTEADIIVNSFEDIIEYLGAKRSLRAAKH